MFSELYGLRNEVSSSSDDDVYVCAATDGTSNAAMISYYKTEKTDEEKDVEIDFGEMKKYGVLSY